MLQTVVRGLGLTPIGSRGRRVLGWSLWIGVGAAMVLAARWVAYAVAPARSTLAARLQGETVPPNPVIVAGVVLGIGALLAIGIVWFAVMGVAERQRLEPRAVAPPPISISRLLARTLVLFVSSALAFSGLESYLHLRAGLGFHGLHCLLGPVHQDVLPFLAAFSLLAAALVSVVEHVLAWIRRTVLLLAGRRFRATSRRVRPRPLHDQLGPRSALVGRANAARAPPSDLVGCAAFIAVRPQRRRLASI
jgi:hypothetical protein